MLAPWADMDADDLYGLALDQFVPERSALARALRRQDRREEADRIAALRKPSVAAWAVNQLVRTQSQALAELLAAGDELREAHRQVIAGHGDGGMLGAAARRQREAVDALVSAARGLLTSEGHELSAATIERITDTLQAAALDPDARAMVREGRLQRELRHVGLGEAEFAYAKPTRRRTDQGAARKAARVAEAAARRRADRAAGALEAAQERRERAAQALRDADEQLARARAEAQDAARELS